MNDLDTKPKEYDELFYLVTFTDDSEIFFIQSAELEDPTMAEAFIPIEYDDRKFGVTCYITNKMNWEPAIVEIIILQQYFQEHGLPLI